MKVPYDDFLEIQGILKFKEHSKLAFIAEQGKKSKKQTKNKSKQ